MKKKKTSGYLNHVEVCSLNKSDDHCLSVLCKSSLATHDIINVMLNNCMEYHGLVLMLCM